MNDAGVSPALQFRVSAMFLLLLPTVRNYAVLRSDNLQTRNTHTKFCENQSTNNKLLIPDNMLSSYYLTCTGNVGVATFGSW
jgi:hypothetical protein